MSLPACNEQRKVTPGYWTHIWRSISFALVVDNFGVKNIGEEHVQHLINALKVDNKIEGMGMETIK